jgi:hypothetical protein
VDLTRFRDHAPQHDRARLRGAVETERRDHGTMKAVAPVDDATA